MLSNREWSYSNIGIIAVYALYRVSPQALEKCEENKASEYPFKFYS